MKGPAYCPHCLLTVAEEARHPFPDQPLQCPHCHLLIGVERARHEPGGGPGMRGSAAGVYASAARHEAAEPVSEEIIAKAIEAAAGQVGCRVDRLLMLDYQRVAEHASLPALHEVLATFGSWKGARRHAAERRAGRAAVKGRR